MSDLNPFFACMNYWCRAPSYTLYTLPGWHGGMCSSCWYRYCAAGWPGARAERPQTQPSDSKG